MKMLTKALPFLFRSTFSWPLTAMQRLQSLTLIKSLSVVE